MPTAGSTNTYTSEETRLISPSDAGVTNIIATPMIGPRRATVPFTSPAIAEDPGPWPRTSSPLRFRPEVAPTFLDHDRLQRDGLADQIDDRERDPDRP